MPKSKSSVQSLTSKLNSLTMKVDKALAKPKPQRKRRASKPKTSKEVFRVTRKILLTTIGKTTATGAFAWSATSIPFLKKYLQLFQSYRLVGNLQLQYVPGCSTTSGGSLMIGYSAAQIRSVTRETVSALTPVVDTPIWQKANLSIPPLLTREGNPSFHGPDDALFNINWAMSSDPNEAKQYPGGELWATLTVEFISPVA